MIQPEDMNNNMYEEEQSYDDVTEPTPEPTNIRPPPPTAQPADLKPSDDSEDDGGNHNNMNEVTQNRSIMNQSLFSFSVDASMTNDGYIDGPISEATSLPSLPMEPPSPISRPSESLFSESASSTRRPHNKVPSNKPMSEVRVINENSEGTETSDDFYECLDDQSLALRAKHSLETKTPSPKKQDVRQEKQLQTTSSKPPRTTSGTTTQDRNSKSYNTPATTSTARRTFLHSSTPLSRSITPSSSPLQNPKSRLVADPQQPSSDDVARVHNDALQALLKMKEELMRANDRNQALQNEKEELEADRDSLQQRLFDAQESVQDQIEETNRNWETRHKRLVEEKEASWRAQRNKLEDEKRAALKQQKDSMKIKLASDNRQRELKTQLSSLREELESALASKEELKSDVGLLQEKKTQLVAENTSLIEQVEALRSSQSPSNEVVETLNSELNAKDEEIASLTAKLEDQKANFEEEISKLQSEVQSAKQTLHDERETNQKELSRLKKGLQTANDTLRSTSVLRPTPSSRGGKTPSSKTPSSFHTNSVRFQQEGFSFDTAASSPREGATLETSIADRLARMRDSAERAHLIRGHKKELARVKTDKEKAIQNLQAAHEEELQLTKKQATAQTNKEVAEVKKSLQEEHVTALEAVEAKHKKTLAEVRTNRKNEDARNVSYNILTKSAHALTIFFRYCQTVETRIREQSRSCR